MFTHKVFNLVLRSLAIVFIIAIFVPFSFSLAEPVGTKSTYPDSFSTFEIGQVEGSPLEDTVEVPVKFLTDSTLVGFTNRITWNPDEVSYVTVVSGPGLPWDSLEVELIDSNCVQVQSYGNCTTFTSEPVYFLRLIPLCFGYGHSISISFSAGDLNFYDSCEPGVNYIPKLVDGAIVVGIPSDQEHLERPIQYSLFQNYPNPFNPETRISYSLPVGCQVSLEVYNIAGEKVVTLVDQRQGAGYHRVTWDASGMASGIYLCRMKAGNFTQTQKMDLLR